MKKSITIVLACAVFFIAGAFAGWWANSPGMDFLCSRAAVYELGRDIEGEGIFIKAGRKVSMRSCEYANRFSIELYSEKGNYPELFIPFNSMTNTGNHGDDQYRVTIREP